jgi:hypothetical protein
VSQRIRGLIAAALASSCGRIEFDQLVRDSTTSSPSCTHDSPFDPPVQLALDTASFWDYPRLSPDDLELYLSAGKLIDDAADVYVANRASSAEPFTSPSPFVELAQPALDELEVTRSADRLTFYYCSGTWNAGGGLSRLRRSTPNGPFGPPEALVALNLDFSDCDPAVTLDGTTLYYRTYSPSQPDVQDIWVAHVDAAGEFAPGTPVTELNLPGTSTNTPFITQDGHAIYFTRGSSPGDPTSYHLFVATRSSLSSPFDVPRRLSELTLPGGDGSPTLTGDNCTLYFASGGAIYEARRHPI